MVDGLRDLPAQLLATLPESMRNDPQVRAEVGRLGVGGLDGHEAETPFSSCRTDGTARGYCSRGQPGQPDCNAFRMTVRLSDEFLCDSYARALGK